VQYETLEVVGETGMGCVISTKVQAYREALADLRQAIRLDAAAPPFRIVEKEAERTFKAILDHQCTDAAELLAKARFIFDEVLSRCDDAPQMRPWLDVVLADMQSTSS
jgi:hypothetical protein